MPFLNFSMILREFLKYFKFKIIKVYRLGFYVDKEYNGKTIIKKNSINIFDNFNISKLLNTKKNKQNLDMKI